MKSHQAKAFVSELERNPPKTLGEALKITSKELKNSGIVEYFQEARHLVCHVFKIDTVNLIAGETHSADIVGIKKLSKVLERRLNGEPVSRITGEIEFYGLPFKLCENTLVPRSDTGTLIDAVLADFQSNNKDCFRVLDIGTGTGAIIISILYNMPMSVGMATDIDSKALEMARLNAAEIGVVERLKFMKTNWCSDVEGKFDIIVSNPPYIRTATIPTLAIEVKGFDPLIALDGGIDGLDAYRIIFTQCSQNIAKNGRLYLEIGYDQCETVVELAKQAKWKFVRLIKDLGANDRILVFEL
jgi:release factor glutamine methyltransferase